MCVMGMMERDVHDGAWCVAHIASTVARCVVIGVIRVDGREIRVD